MHRNGDDNVVQERVESLFVLLQRLEGLHVNLRAVLSDKLESMKKSDLAALHESVERERALTARINEQEGLRKQLMERIGRGYGLASQAARTLSAGRLAERLTEAHRGRLDAAASRLRAAVVEVAKINAMIGRVSSQVLKHLGALFGQIGGAEASPGAYSKSGRTVAGRPFELFEAVG